jgi:ubiquinone/menaquinone biosynthesis C-methylase UbiE
MSIVKLKKDIGGIDIYLLDQILKERYRTEDKILDAGCGQGRNLTWFYDCNFSLYGVDTNTSRIEAAKIKYPRIKSNLSVQNLDVLQFNDDFFDHIICNAVLHFAQNRQHFLNMFSELMRVLKPGGSLFIRMTSVFGIESLVKPISDGVYFLPDQTNRFLLTSELLEELQEIYPISFMEPLKTVNVNNVRCMSTLVLQKGNI